MQRQAATAENLLRCVDASLEGFGMMVDVIKSGRLDALSPVRRQKLLLELFEDLRGKYSQIRAGLSGDLQTPTGGKLHLESAGRKLAIDAARCKALIDNAGDVARQFRQWIENGSMETLSPAERRSMLLSMAKMVDGAVLAADQTLQCYVETESFIHAARNQIGELQRQVEELLGTATRMPDDPRPALSVIDGGKAGAVEGAADDGGPGAA